MWWYANESLDDNKEHILNKDGIPPYQYRLIFLEKGNSYRLISERRIIILLMHVM